MNSRHIFYSLTFLEEFRRLGWRAPYLIYTLTDENYAVNCALAPDEPGRHTLMLLVALFSRCHRNAGHPLRRAAGAMDSLGYDGH